MGQVSGSRLIADGSIVNDQRWLAGWFEGHWRRRCFAWIPAGVGMTKCGGGDDVVGGGIRAPYRGTGHEFRSLD